MSDRAQQALILAAGRGSRLGLEGAQQPKCLLPVAGRPMLAWSLDALRRCGIENIHMVAGWQADRLQDWACRIIINPHWTRSGVVRSLMQADALLRQATTLVLYGDGVYSERVLAAVLQAAPADILIPGDRRWHALWSRRFADPLQDAETWEAHDGMLRQIGARPASLDEVNAQFMGLMRLTPSGWNLVQSRLRAWEHADGSAAIDRLDTTALLQRLLRDGVRLSCIEVDGGWVEIDTLRDRDVVERSLGEKDFVHDFR